MNSVVVIQGQRKHEIGFIYGAVKIDIGCPMMDFIYVATLVRFSSVGELFLSHKIFVRLTPRPKYAPLALYYIPPATADIGVLFHSISDLPQSGE